MKAEPTDVRHKQVGIIIVNKGNFSFWILYLKKYLKYAEERIIYSYKKWNQLQCK